MDINGFKQEFESLSLEEKIEIWNALGEEIKKEAPDFAFGNSVGTINCDINVNCLSPNDLAEMFSALALRVRKEKPFAE